MKVQTEDPNPYRKMRICLLTIIIRTVEPRERRLVRTYNSPNLKTVNNSTETQHIT